MKAYIYPWSRKLTDFRSLFSLLLGFEFIQKAIQKQLGDVDPLNTVQGSVSVAYQVLG